MRAGGGRSTRMRAREPGGGRLLLSHANRANVAACTSTCGFDYLARHWCTRNVLILLSLSWLRVFFFGRVTLVNGGEFFCCCFFAFARFSGSLEHRGVSQG